MKKILEHPIISGLILLGVPSLITTFIPNGWTSVFNWLSKTQQIHYWIIILTIIFILFESLYIIYSIVKNKKKRIPKETVKIVPDLHSCNWSLGKFNNEQCMHLHGRMTATNIKDFNVSLLRTFIKNPKIEGHVIVQHPKSNKYGNYPILPRSLSDISVDFTILPPIKKTGQDFKTTIMIIDHLGNAHKVKNVIFKGSRIEIPQKEKVQKESMYSISNPIEKEIVAVLKDEVSKYKICGRSKSGLGSINAVRHGTRLAGVALPWRDNNAKNLIEKEQDIVFLQSDNLDKLIKIYNKINSEEGRNVFFIALASRLKSDSEYSSVSYLMLYAFFKLQRLPDILTIAKKTLINDHSNGFGDFTRLLDALLRYEHNLFSSSELDEIEKFIENINKETWRISERIAAIRINRIK